MAHEITAVTGETGKPRTYQLVAIDRLYEVKREVFPRSELCWWQLTSCWPPADLWYGENKAPRHSHTRQHADVEIARQHVQIPSGDCGSTRRALSLQPRRPRRVTVEGGAHRALGHTPLRPALNTIDPAASKTHRLKPRTAYARDYWSTASRGVLCTAGSRVSLLRCRCFEGRCWSMAGT
jgi:hypothetical protein